MMSALPTSAVRRRWLRALLGSSVMVVLGGLLGGCTPGGPPQAVVNVPFNFVANLRDTPTFNFPEGNSFFAQVVVCLDEQSAVLFEEGVGGIADLDSIRLEWNGTEYRGYGTLTTPELAPGCGLLTFSQACCTLWPTLAIKGTKV